ncbi:MAG: hypothetical protein Q7R70_03490 [Candidatus Diapherotrites archaeon]|nr:hypothetical protein [Candidatus Diapherotrites archaeon]
MRLIPLLFALIVLIGLSGFASASWLSQLGHNIKDEVSSKNLKTDWHFTYKHVSQPKHRTFDSARCGTYYWNVQDRKYCMGEWKEKGIIIKGW